MKNTKKPHKKPQRKPHLGHVFSKWEQLLVNLCCELHRSYYLYTRKLRPRGSTGACPRGHSWRPTGSKVGYGAGVLRIPEPRAALLRLRILLCKEEVGPHPAHVIGLS